MNRMNVVAALNKAYLLYTGIMLYSLCVNNRVAIRVFLLHSELEESDIKVLENALREFDIEIVPLKINEELFGEHLPKTEVWSMATYYRLTLLELLPEDVERLLYVDGDIIVNKSLEELYQVEFEGDEIIAAEDVCGKKSWDEFSDKQKEMFAPMIEAGYRYFNAGFMLLNIAEMRKKYSFDTYLRAMQEWEYQMFAADQDILNYVHWQKVGYIDCYEYDLFARIAHNEGITYEQVKEDARIIHYAGYKPWDADNCHFDIEQIWWDYAKQTPFYSKLLEDFLYEMMRNDNLEKYINSLLTQIEETQRQLQEVMTLNKKFISIIQGNR